MVINFEFLIVILVSIAWYLLLSNYFFVKRDVIAKLDRIFAVLVVAFVFEVIPFDSLSLQTLISGNTILEKVLLRVAIYFAVFYALRKWFGNFSANIYELVREPFIRLLLAWSFLSFSWSGTPLLCIQSNLAMLLEAALATHFAKKYSWKQLSEILRWTLLICCFISIIATMLHAKLPGSIGSVDTLNLEGEAQNKSLASALSLNVGLWTLYSYSSKYRILSALAAVASFVSIFYINSVANIFTAIILVYLVVLLGILKRFNQRSHPLVVWFYLVLGIFLVLLIQNYVEAVFGAFNKSSNLTGRTDVWPTILSEIAKRPWTGYGYASYWQEWRGNNDPSINFAFPNIRHAHNGVLELALQLGLVGVILYALFSLRGIALAIRHYFMFSSVEDATFPLLLLVFSNFTCLAETPRLGVVGPNYIWFLLILAFTKLTMDARGEKRQI
jgi:O-antigen ligase